MNIINPQDAATEAVEQSINMRHAVEAIPLNRLVSSGANVRRVRSTTGVPELADSIEAHGLLHNLTVRKGKKGRYEVVAGGRRLAALRLLAKEGRLAADVDIPCNVRDADSDTELSLAENVQREAMHVVDEILAYRDLAETGMAPETIAARFGQSVLTVRQRLKLANLSPKVLEVMREDGITIEQARALAVSDDHEEQERVWFDAPAWNRDPRSLRALLTREHARSTDRLARFVGLEAYEAAGGTVLRDLFADETGCYLTDQPLLARLALNALETAAEPYRSEGWKWVETTLDASASYSGGHGRVYPQMREPTEAEQAELADLGTQYDALQAQMETYAEGDPALAEDERRLAEIEAAVTAIRNAAKSYDGEEQALAGCILGIDHAGGLYVGRGYVKDEDRDALERLRRGQDGDADEADSMAPAAPTETDAGYSAALVEELTALRTAALRLELANRPAVALAALLYPLAGRLFQSGYGAFDTAVEVSGQRRDLAPAIKEPEKARALSAWQAMKDAWGETLPGQPADLWDWLLQQSTDKLLDLLAFTTAANLNAVKAKHDHSKARLDNAERIAEAVNLDMREHWQADATFLCRLSKGTIAEVLADAGCSPEEVHAVEKAQKADAVGEAEKQLADKDWLPPLLRGKGDTA
jgi:ParB family transcriptional regulator, chromosome partitioning protein